MSDLLNSEETAQSVVQQAEGQLLQSADPSSFSPSAFTTLETRIGQYISELVSESIKVSKRHQADTVSAAHVERANEYLVTNTSRRIYRHLGTVGGVLLGAALSHIPTMSSAGRYTSEETVLSAALGIVGAFMIALHMAKD
ncbi:MAG: hypothetical protein HKP13_04060 [Gammaproteobacteria bacterium]|nr:hypothetical protein [Gammaproteobacteria bacterium]